MQLKRITRLLALCSLMLMVFVGNSAAQAVYGSIIGTVTDTSGAAVVGAKVTVTDINKGISDTTTTNASGNYQVLHLIPDSYAVKVEGKGFKVVENKGVIVSADTAARVDLKLEVGGASELVEVTSEAPQLKTDRADVAQLLDEHITTDLPLAGRNFTSLELLTPGAVYQAGWQHSTTENPQESQQIFINGQQFGGTSYQLDGTDNKDPVLGIIIINPTLESVGEIKITTQNYDAEFGNGTAGVITAQTKSGSNNFHGSLYNYRRSGANQAKDPFVSPDPVTGKIVPSSLWDQFGGSIGGPIIKNKLFFFGDYQGTRRRTGNSLISTVPTTTIRNTCLSSSSAVCDLSEYLPSIQIYDPATGNADGSGRTPFTGNIIPKARLNATAVKLLGLMPTPTKAGTTSNYAVSGSAPFNDDQFNVRSDYQLKENFHIFGRYTYARFTQKGKGAFGTLDGPGFLNGNATGNDLGRNDSIAAGFDYAISPTLMTDFRFGYFRYHIMNDKYDAANMSAATDLGLPGLNTGAYGTGGLPTFNFTDGNTSYLSTFGMANCNCPLDEDEKQIQFVNNWTKIYKNHQIKFGVDLRLAMNLRDASDINRTGLFNINSLGTASDQGGGLSVATFLLGGVSQFERYVIRDNHFASEHQKRDFAYIQDTWRVTPKLTLNLGLRWDDIFPETVTERGKGGSTNLVTGTIDVAGVGGVPMNGGIANNWTNFALRVGAAYQLTPKTVIRGGYGRAFDEGIFGLIFGSALTHNQPVMATQNLVQTDQHQSLAMALGTAPASYVWPSIPSDGHIPMAEGQSYYAARPRKMKLVAVDSYNLTIQHQINNSTSVQIGYVGNWGAHIAEGYWGYNANQPSMPTSASDPLSARMPLWDKYNHNGVTCCRTEIDYLGPDANSNYNSIQTGVNRRMSNGLQINAFYVWSKSLDHSGDYFAVNQHFGYGPGDYNRTHNATAAVIYDLPFGKGKAYANHISKAADYLVGGWQLSTVTSWASGLPFTWSYANASADGYDTGLSMRPTKTGAFQTSTSKFDAANKVVQYFIPVATLTKDSNGIGEQVGPWRRPDSYTFGNQVRNSGVGPSMFTSDLSISKNFAITEIWKGEFKMDVYNLFNHPVLGSPNSCVDCSTGGQISNLQGGTYMRRLQFGARFSF